MPRASLLLLTSLLAGCAADSRTPVPPEAFNDPFCMIVQHMEPYVSSPAFERWLASHGTAGVRAAMQDARLLSEIYPHTKLWPEGGPPLRVKDVAYQLQRDSQMPPILLYHSYRARDDIIESNRAKILAAHSRAPG